MSNEHEQKMRAFKTLASFIAAFGKDGKAANGLVDVSVAAYENLLDDPDELGGYLKHFIEEISNEGLHTDRPMTYFKGVYVGFMLGNLVRPLADRPHLADRVDDIVARAQVMTDLIKRGYTVEMSDGTKMSPEKMKAAIRETQEKRANDV